MKKMYVLVLSLAVLLVAAAIGYAYGPSDDAKGVGAMAGMGTMSGMEGMHRGMGMENMDIDAMLQHHNQMHGTSLVVEEMQEHHNSMHGSGGMGNTAITGKMGCGN